MTTTIAKVCAHTSRIHHGPCNCPTHQQARKQETKRRAAKPQRKVWDSTRWKATSLAVRKRDHWTCVDCKRHITQLHPNERLLADHVRGLRTIQAEGLNPYDAALCVARCSTCSGRKDGGMT